MRLEISGKVYEVEVEETGHGVHAVTVDGTTYEVRVPVEIVDAPPERAVEQPSRQASTPGPASRPPVASGGEGTVVAPLPGSVQEIQVAEGDAVSRGQVVVIMESMKMNVPVKSRADGTVRKIHAKEGDSLQVGDTIMEIG